jgi:uncharacterized damage-inducible protein DinB
MTPRSSLRRSDPVADLLQAYSASARVNQYLVEHLDPSVWRAKDPGGSKRSIAALVAHLHNCGLIYLERTDPAAAVPAELDRYKATQAQAAKALAAKRRAVLAVVGAALAGNGEIVGFPGGAVRYLTYYMVHDAHHRGQVVEQARRLGHPVTTGVMSGMWQWNLRAKE